MRNFFNAHWKVILAILLAIVLAVLTVETRSGPPPLAARLQSHMQALAPESQRDALRHVETSLRRYGYKPRTIQVDRARHAIQISLANPSPGISARQVFILGAHLGPELEAGAGTAAVLELARALAGLRLAPGTELRFVFFVDDSAATGAATGAGMAVAGQRAQPGAGNFMAFMGSRDASQRVRQALAGLRSDPLLARQGLAAPAHVMGLTLSGHGSADGAGPALVITDTGFLRYPYFRAGTARQIDYDGMARIVDGLERTVRALAGAAQA